MSILNMQPKNISFYCRQVNNNSLNPIATLIFLFMGLLGTTYDAQAQTDTTWGNGEIIFQDKITQVPLSDVAVTGETTAMQDTLLPQIRTDTTDANGAINYNRITEIKRGIGLFEEYKTLTKVFPVPGNGINFQLPTELSDNYTLSVIDMAGRVVHQEDFNGNHIYEEFNDVAKGTYIYNITNKTGNNSLIGKIVIDPELPAYGPRESVDGPGKQESSGSLKTSNTASDVEFSWKDVYGYVNGSQTVQIDSGFNATQIIDVTPWGWGYANGVIKTRDNISTNFVSSVPLTLTTTQMQDVVIPHVESLNSGLGGVVAYSQRPIAVDTASGIAPTTSGQVQIAWAQTPNPAYNINSKVPTFPYWEADDTTVTMQPGTNPNINLLLKRGPVDYRVGKEWVDVFVGLAPNGSTALEKPADSALVTLTYQNGTKDSSYTSNGWTTMLLGEDGDTTNFEIKFPNGYDLDGFKRNRVNSYRIVNGLTPQRISQTDTSQYIGVWLYTDSTKSQKSNTMINATIANMQDLYQFGQEQATNNPNGLNIAMDTLQFAPGKRLKVVNDMDTLASEFNTWTNAKINVTYTPYANTGTFNPLTFGTNFEEGTASATAQTGGQVNGFNTLRYVDPLEISGIGLDEHLREVGQSYAFNSTTYPGLMSLTGITSLTDLDCANIDNIVFFNSKSVNYTMTKQNGLQTEQLSSYSDY